MELGMTNITELLNAQRMRLKFCWLRKLISDNS